MRANWTMEAVLTRAEILECNMLQPPQELREELALQPGETALHLVRVRERDGSKFGYYESWTAGVKMPRRPTVFTRKPRLTYFRENGLDITHVTQTLTAVAADTATSKALDVPVGAPLLCLIRLSYNKAGNEEQLRDYLHVQYVPEHFQYKMDLEIE